MFSILTMRQCNENKKNVKITDNGFKYINTWACNYMTMEYKYIPSRTADVLFHFLKCTKKNKMLTSSATTLVIYQ